VEDNVTRESACGVALGLEGDLEKFRSFLRRAQATPNRRCDLI
jgi:hypothetical protein